MTDYKTVFSPKMPVEEQKAKCHQYLQILKPSSMTYVYVCQEDGLVYEVSYSYRHVATVFKGIARCQDIEIALVRAND